MIHNIFLFYNYIDNRNKLFNISYVFRNFFNAKYLKVFDCSLFFSLKIIKTSTFNKHFSLETDYKLM